MEDSHFEAIVVFQSSSEMSAGDRALDMFPGKFSRWESPFSFLVVAVHLQRRRKLLAVLSLQSKCGGVSQVPDVVSSSSPSLHTESQAQVCLSEESSKNVRRITTV